MHADPCYSQREELIFLYNNKLFNFSLLRGVSKRTQELMVWPGNHMHIGELKLAILMSGNSFGKLKLTSRFLLLKIMSRRTFLTYQKKYIAPVVEDHWKAERANILFRHSPEPVGVCG